MTPARGPSVSMGRRSAGDGPVVLDVLLKDVGGEEAAEGLTRVVLELSSAAAVDNNAEEEGGSPPPPEVDVCKESLANLSAALSRTCSQAK